MRTVLFVELALLEYLVSFAFLVTRVFAAVIFIPIYGSNFINYKLKMLLSFAIAIALIELINTDNQEILLSDIHIIIKIIYSIAWSDNRTNLQVIFLTLDTIGQIISHAIGLSSALDQQQVVTSSSIGSIIKVITIMLFLVSVLITNL